MLVEAINYQPSDAPGVGTLAFLHYNFLEIPCGKIALYSLLLGDTFWYMWHHLDPVNWHMSWRQLLQSMTIYENIIYKLLYVYHDIYWNSCDEAMVLFLTTFFNLQKGCAIICDSIYSSLVGFFVPENIGAAVGISLHCHVLDAEIYVIHICLRYTAAILNLHIRSSCTVYSPIGLPYPVVNMDIVVKISLLSCILDTYLGKVTNVRQPVSGSHVIDRHEGGGV